MSRIGRFGNNQSTTFPVSVIQMDKNERNSGTGKVWGKMLQ